MSVRFGPLGVSKLFSVSSTSARIALEALPTVNPAVALVSLQPQQSVWWVKFGDSSVTATITDALRCVPGSKESPLILPITGSPTHIAILAEGEPGNLVLTSGQQLFHEFAPSGTGQSIAVTQTDQRIALPTLGSPIGAFTLVAEQALMEALWIKLGNSGVTGSITTSMKITPGKSGDPVIIRPTASETHLSIFCEGEPGSVILTPGAMNSSIGNLSQAQALDFLDLQSTDSPTFRRLTLNDSTTETKLIITNSNAGANKNSGIEIGRTDNVAASSYIDFHSGATSTDYDARIIAANGTGTDGQGDLTIAAQTLNLNATNLLTNGVNVRGLVLLATGTVSSAATLDIVLTTMTAFRTIDIVFENFVPATDAATLEMRFSTDGGSSYDAGASNYAFANTRSRTGTTTPVSDVNAAATRILIAGSGGASGVSNVSGEGGCSGIVTLYGRTQASYTGAKYATGAFSGDTQAVPIDGWGVRLAAQDTDAIRLLFSSGNIASGRYAVYGRL